MPKVSVVIPTFNRARYICETIDSVFAQTFKDYEIIVVDDGSTDDTKEILKRYGDKIKYFYQENQGQAFALNFAVSQAKGEYIAILDSDDLWLPEKLDQQLKVMDQDSELGLVCTEADAFKDGGEVFYRIKKGWLKKDNFESIFDENFICTASVLMRKKCFEGAGGFDPKLRTTQDYDLWLRFTKRYKFFYINTPLVKYREHVEGVHKKLKQKLKDHLCIFSKNEIVGHLSSFGKKIKIAREYYEFAIMFAEKKEYGGAVECFLKAIIRCPWVGTYYWPQETQQMKFSKLYRILKVYWMLVRCFIKQLFTPKSVLRKSC